jgi:outer membrane protein assembly factor BamB
MRRSMRFSTVAAVLLLAVPLLSAQSKVGPWPQFRGPTGQGIVQDEPLPTTWSKSSNVISKTALPGMGASSPIIVGDKIYLTCYTGFGRPGKDQRYLVCLNKSDAQVAWSKEVPSQLPDSARTRDDHGYTSSTPAADSERLYVFFGKSGVFAFDHDGKQMWHADVGSKVHEWGTAASPVLHGDLCIVNASVESGALVGLDRRTGKEKWRLSGINDSWNTPILVQTPDGKTELVLASMGKVHGIEPASGQQLWTCRTDIGWYMVPSLVAHEGIVYCLGGRSGIVGLAVRAGGRGEVTMTHRLWTSNKGSNVTSPVYHDGHLYWMNDNLGIAYCADAKTGAVRYEERLGRAGQVYASPLLADGKIYYVERTGTTHVIAAQPKFQELAVNQLGERDVFNASPAAAEGRLYLRSDRYLYCLGAK